MSLKIKIPAIAILLFACIGSASAHEHRQLAITIDDLPFNGYTDRGWSFITPLEALTDPVYQLPAAYVGTMGLSHLERIR